MIPPFYSSFPSFGFGGSFAILFYSFFIFLFGIICTKVQCLFYIPCLSSQLWQRDIKTWATKQKHTHIQRATSTFLWNSWGYGFGNRRTRPGIPSLEMDAYGIMGTWQYVMVYGFGIIGFGLGLGSFCRLPSSSGFFFCLFCPFFCAGFLYPPVIFFWLFAFCFLEHPLPLLYCISFLRSFHINFSPLSF